MSESFAELFKNSVEQSRVQLGSIVKGTVVQIGPEMVIIHAGLKSEGRVPVGQFYNEQGQLEIKPGDEVEVVLEDMEDGAGFTRLSREKAKRLEAWNHLMQAHADSEPVMGVISTKVKGGFTVDLIDLQNIRAFLPGSLIDIKSSREPMNLEGKKTEFKVIKIDRKRNNVVVSRRFATDSEGGAERDALMALLHEGQVVSGIVKNLTDYGAFVDLGGIDGLLHITDMGWRRVKHPSEVVSVGQELTVKVLKFDRERSRVSLGLKQLTEDPWIDIEQRYPEHTQLVGKVTNITDYGCFVEIEDGVEGLVHVSEMDWTNKNIHPSKVVTLGMDVEVMVLEIDEERRRISLGLKQCKENPWENFAHTHHKGDKVSGKIKSITDFGIFIGLEGGIDGLVHLSDIAWNETGEQAVRRYKKGEELEAVVLAVDPERERISLGIKQLEEDKFSHFMGDQSKESIVSGLISAVDAKGAVVQLADGVEGYLKASELSRDRIEDARTILTVGDTVEAKIINFDRKNQKVNLSIKAKDSQEEQAALEEINREGPAAPTLGDLLKEKMDTNRDEG